MGACRHSCCIGWEIDIDEESAARFRSVPGNFGEKLRRNVDFSATPACFRLTEEERCPFLNGDGLCEMIIHLGENSLCQVCDDHPRFRSFFSDRTETGLGLCCEAAARLILTWEKPVRLVLLGEESGSESIASKNACAGYTEEDSEALTDAEKNLLALREEMISLMQDRTIPFCERLCSLKEKYLPSMPAFDRVHWGEFLLTLERLDEAWADRLNRLIACGARAPLPPMAEIPLEQLTVYLLIRHLPLALEDGDLAGHMGFILLMAELMQALMQSETGLTVDTMTELVRLYSSEIEYSDENMGAIIDELYALGLDGGETDILI